MAPITLEELVHSAAQRPLEQQDADLSDLRTRTSTLLAAATLSASFLGAPALGHHAPAWLLVPAIAAFLATGTLAGWVLWPARVRFALDAGEMHRALHPDRDEPSKLILRAAYGLREAYLTNRRLIEQRELIFRLALLALGAETPLWSIALALT
jgi:hypothetical protein